MTGIYIVKGKPSMGANLIAAAVKRSGKYDYRVKVQTNDECTIEFYERVDGKRELIGSSTFTKSDAVKAGTQNIDKFPRNMLFARAMSNGAKWFCADVFGGPIYTPDELGATVNEEGEVIDQISGPKWTDAEDDKAYIEAQTATPEEVKPEAPRQTYRVSKVKFNGMSPEQWHKRCDDFAANHPHWETSGMEPDMNHILMSAGAAGYEFITGENVDAVLADIVRLHESKAA